MLRLRKIFLPLALFLITIHLSADKVELKSGKVYSNVLTFVEPNSLLIYTEDGKKEEVPKTELKRITLQIVSWTKKESTQEKNEIVMSTSSEKENQPIQKIENTSNEIYPNAKEFEKEVIHSKQIKENLDKRLFAQISYVNWQVGGMENLIGMKSSRLVNGFLFRRTGLAWTSFPIVRLNDDSMNVKGRAFDLGYIFGESTNYPAKIQLRLISSGTANFTSLNLWEYSNPTLNFTTREMEIFAFDTNRRTIFAYEQKYFFNSKQTSLQSSRFGIQGGLNAQFDRIKGSLTSIGSGSGVNSSGTTVTQFAIPIAAKNQYSEQSYFLYLGGVYSINLFENQELEMGVSLYQGVSSGNVNYNHISVYPISNGSKKEFNSNLNGFGFNFGYIFSLSELWNLKLSFENRNLTYKIKNIKTSNFNFNLGSDLGPISQYKDNLNTFGISAEYKF